MAWVLAAIALSPAGTGVAEPKPTKSELKAELASLTKKIDKLIKEYNGRRVALADAQTSETAAKQRLTKAEDALDLASREIGDMAQLHYQANTNVVPGLPFGQNIAGAALLQQLAAEESAHLEGYASARDSRKNAVDEAAGLTDKIRGQAKQVDEQRKEAEDLIDQIEKRLDKLVPVGSGKRSDGSWAPQLPSGADNITPRTRLMRNELQGRYNLSFPVGCYRVDTSGEHPLGRACDFMLSSGGSMPSPSQAALGDQMAEWAIKNAGKLGVKYVIYKQRIYNMSSPGWRAMSNRGSITQNHFDHVHISMY
jgi:hypothetical protein